jgi:hypothetical protein
MQEMMPVENSIGKLPRRSVPVSYFCYNNIQQQTEQLT